MNTFSLPAALCGQLLGPVWGHRNQDLDGERVQACTHRPRGWVLCSVSAEPRAGPGQPRAVMVPPPPSDPSALRLAWVLMPLLFLLSSLAHLAYQVVKVKPHDKDAKMKYQECNKIVKQKAFERAIAGDEHKRSVVDSLDIESMSESAQVPCCARPRAFPVLARALRAGRLWSLCPHAVCAPGDPAVQPRG